jgi:ergothioneine biosynthesis protein EgtB
MFSRITPAFKSTNRKVFSKMTSPSLNARPSAQSNDVRHHLLDEYRQVRQRTEAICRPLVTEDYGIQTMQDVSPPKWHLAHVSWFFETFLLLPFSKGYQVFHPRYDDLFNSYYETHGKPFPRPQRGLLSRPTVAEIYRYRAHVDDALEELIGALDERHWPTFAERLILGLHHEQQHQELLFTDIKHIYAFNPLRPAYQERSSVLSSASPGGIDWVEYAGGVQHIGFDGDGFCFDNEMPRHRVYVRDYALASRLVTCGEYLEFIKDGGYERPEYWLADGWKTVAQLGWRAPLYWEKQGSRWWLMTLSGMRPVEEREPVCHVSFLRSRCLCALGGQTPSRRSRVGTGRGPRALGGEFSGIRPASSLSRVQQG